MGKNKKIIFISAVCFLIVASSFVIKKKFFNNEVIKTYDVLVQVRDQKTGDSEDEDMKTSLKKGDVVLLKEEGHVWSNTEKVSYLILKMNLTEKEAQKLTESVYKKLSRKEIKKEVEKFKKERKDVSDEELDSFKDELKNRRKVVVLRKYAIDFEKYFSDFKKEDLLYGQPYDDKIFDWFIVKRKQSFLHSLFSY
jgi:uncharacterized membrane-anchored protein